jgi:aspartate-semialdehyde dehydrogenase
MVDVAIVGATGAVGTELVRLLETRSFPVGTLRLFASARSAGTTVAFRGQSIPVRPLDGTGFEGVGVAFFSAGAPRSREYVPHARRAGALVIDNSSAFRMDPDVPLVVPEVNPNALSGHQGLIANPNCVAAILTVAVAPLIALARPVRMLVVTYQSASGAGARAMEDLLTQTRAYLAGEPVVPRVLKHPYAFNLFSHDSAIEANGYNGEENKVAAETRKILGLDQLGMSITSVRVPVLRAHTLAINLELDREITLAQARDALARAPGVRLVDDAEANHFPMPNEASGQGDVLVGRVRQDPSRSTALNLLCCGDQLLKGAALNAIQIAERMVA